MLFLFLLHPLCHWLPRISYEIALQEKRAISEWSREREREVGKKEREKEEEEDEASKRRRRRIRKRQLQQSNNHSLGAFTGVRQSLALALNVFLSLLRVFYTFHSSRLVKCVCVIFSAHINLHWAGGEYLRLFLSFSFLNKETQQENFKCFGRRGDDWSISPAHASEYCICYSKFTHISSHMCWQEMQPFMFFMWPLARRTFSPEEDNLLKNKSEECIFLSLSDCDSLRSKFHSLTLTHSPVIQTE